MKGDEVYKTEYDRIIHYVLFEQMKLLHNIADNQNPFQSEEQPISSPPFAFIARLTS